jgi:taurine dioxygenase
VSSLTTTGLSTRFGAQVHGYEPSADLDTDTATALRGLLDEHKLLLFRGVPFEPEQHVALTRAFGPVIDENGTGKDWFSFSNVEPDSSTLVRTSRLPFHQDYVFTPWPFRALSLYASEIVGGVSHTEFASNHGGYLGLNAMERERFAALKAVHARKKGAVVRTNEEHRKEWREDEYDGEPKRVCIAADPDQEQYWRTEWPVIKRHPRTDEPMLFVGQLYTSHILGVDTTNSEDVIERSHDLLYRSENIYVHDWELYDLVVWDNVALQHARGANEPNTRRTMRRVTISDKSRDDMLAAASNGVDGELAASM